MDLNLSGLHGHSLVVVGRALVEIGEIQERERDEFRLAARASGLSSAGTVEAEARTEQIQAQEAATDDKPAKKPRAAKAAASAEAPTPETSAGASAPASAAAPASPSEPAVTLVDLRARLAELSRDGKADKVKALLAQFGVAKLTELDPSKFADVMAAAEAI
jgi:hypothetical protein